MSAERAVIIDIAQKRNGIAGHFENGARIVGNGTEDRTGTGSQSDGSNIAEAAGTKGSVPGNDTGIKEGMMIVVKSSPSKRDGAGIIAEPRDIQQCAVGRRGQRRRKGRAADRSRQCENTIGCGDVSTVDD